MATVKGDIKTIADAATASHTNDPGYDQGRVRASVDSYEASTLVTGSIIEMGTKLPLNAIVLETKMAYDALGSATSLKQGDYEDDDRYVTNTATTSAGVTRMNTVDGVGYKCDETNGASNSDRQIIVTMVDSGSANNTIKSLVLWSKGI